ncbi:MAG TPA: NAD-glutamate dehydrogenase, partial [Gammaproteobacteria bacterium]|nr:NAD-glutamate dehydrogenase [Gammaproteobacteria bacterium]
TDEVAQLVLLDNYEQTQMLSLEASVSLQTIDLFRRYMNELEKLGRLNRKLESLPDEKNLLERKAGGKGLTRPELAILLAYSKMFLKQDILATDIPEDPHFTKHLKMAFPTLLCEKFMDYIREHSLRREIIATQLGKSITDRMGINFIERLQRETGASVASIIRAYTIAATIFNLEVLWQQIEDCDYKVKPAVQQKMMLQIYHLIRRATRWFLRSHASEIDIEEGIQNFIKPISTLIQQIPDILEEQDKDYLENEIKNYVMENVPASLAKSIATCPILFTSLDVVEASRRLKLPISDVATTYYLLGTQLDLNWLRDQMNHYPIENQWDELARSGYRDDLDRAQRKLSLSVLSSKVKDKSIKHRIEVWMNEHAALINRWQNLLAEIKSSTNINFVTFSVVMRELMDFAQAG